MKKPFPRQVVNLLIIIAGSILLALAVVFIFPLLGLGGQDGGRPTIFDAAGISLEKSLKDLIKSQIEAEDKIVTRPAVAGAMEKLSARLLPLIKDNPFQVEILVVESPTVNALAFPGGLVVIFSGLIENTDNAFELAGILAHELGHVAHHDSMNLIVRHFTVAILLNIVSGGRSPQEVNDIINSVVNSGYSREQEQSADDFAFDLLSRAGINPLHMAHMFEKFEKIGGENDGLLKYFTTHPPLAERRQKALERAAEFSKIYKEEKQFDIDWAAVKKALPATTH
jgi:predicted Zn-dependent protease